MELSGITSLRTIQASVPPKDFMKECQEDFAERYPNEIMPYYDETGEYLGVYLKTKPFSSGEGSDATVKESELVPIIDIDTKNQIEKIESSIEDTFKSTKDYVDE
jgi:hypothetical protein